MITDEAARDSSEEGSFNSATVMLWAVSELDLRKDLLNTHSIQMLCPKRLPLPSLRRHELTYLPGFSGA